MIVNMIFFNIDWKQARHDTPKSTRRNKTILHETIAGIVRQMTPVVLCMCEVGTASDLLTEAHMQEIAKTIQKALKIQGAEHFRLKFLFTADAPYMTAYDEFRIQCTEHRIFRNLYSAQRQPRTAQMFLCRGPDGSSVDVINVHAPSGKPSLSDAKRNTLLRNLLQSNSESSPGRTIGTARFVIGGDMNKAPHSLSQMLQVLRQQGVLQTQAQVMEGTMPKHGDGCFV